MKTKSTILTSLAAITMAALVLTAAVPSAYARKGADDPAGHNAGDNHGGKRGKVAGQTSAQAKAPQATKRRGGHDDKPAHH